MRSKVKVSVIVPIYGVELYIERCVRSLLSQTLKEMEFIFVDDCTQDNSIRILENVLEDYPGRKAQVTILHHETNKGLPQARRTGVSYAHGDYVAHCDSDDWVDSEMYEKMYLTAIQSGADIVVSDFYKSDGISESVYIPVQHQRLLTGPVWNKLVKRSLYENGIVYPQANKAEDGALMVQLSYYSQKMVYIDVPLYYYFFNPESICRLPDKQSCISRFEQEKENADLIESFLTSVGKADYYKPEIIGSKISAKKNLLPYIKEREFYTLWRKAIPGLTKQVFLTRGLDIRKKIAYLIILLGMYPMMPKKITQWT